MRLLPVQGDLPVERGALTNQLDGIRAITFDFGNTLVPVGRAALGRVVDVTADAVTERIDGIERSAFLEAWADERERQFREDVPQFREVDLAERLVRVFARLRGMAPPGVDATWDQEAAGRLSDPDEVSWTIDAYSRAFVEALPPAPGIGAMLERLARERSLAILSNWPLAATIDRFAEANGWLPYLQAIVVSQRVGTIKPHPRIFAVARKELGDLPPEAILHVGDDWAADVVGASAAGWRTAWLAERPPDTPLPTSERDGTVRPDLELTSMDELESRLGSAAAVG
jgi:HAD superfamily hydrolase (TIGR01509 family)